jgi:hypothetical protein
MPKQIHQAKITLFLFLIGVCPILLFSQQEPTVLAVISDVTGEVFIKKMNKSEPQKALFGIQLAQGDQITTSKKSNVTLLFSNGQMIGLGPNSQMIISGNTTADNSKNIGSALAGNFSNLTLRRDNKGEVGVLMDLRAGESEQFIIPMSPCNTMIRTNLPELSWESLKPADTYMVRLFNTDGLVWEKETSDTRLPYPEHAPPLTFGESYFWNVEGLELIHSFKSLNQKFSILPKHEIEAVNDREEEIKTMFADDLNSSSFHSVLGAYYAQMGMLEEAIHEFIQVKKANPDASLPHEILGKLYRDVGKKDLAIKELQEALMLEKEQ